VKHSWAVARRKPVLSWLTFPPFPVPAGLGLPMPFAREWRCGITASSSSAGSGRPSSRYSPYCSPPASIAWSRRSYTNRASRSSSSANRPQDYVRSTVSSKVEHQLVTIKQQVLSRTTLTKTMDELRLFEKERKKLNSEELFAMMRKRIEIDVIRGASRDSSEAFSLSFLHENPQSAMLAAARWPLSSSMKT